MVMMMNRTLSDIVHHQQCPTGQLAKTKIFGGRGKKRKKFQDTAGSSSTTSSRSSTAIHLEHQNHFCYNHHHHYHHHYSYHHAQKFATSGSCSSYYYYNSNNTWPSILDIGWPLLLLLLVALLLLTPIRGAISPHCRCIIFDDTFGKEFGVFTSPDWPKPYEDNIECLLYKFIAQDDHIVEINFDEFDVQRVMPQQHHQQPSTTKSSSSSSSTSLDSNQNFGCDQGDYVKLFLHLKTDWINEQTEWNEPLLCGKFPDIEQTHFSSNRVLMFEFHSDWRTGNSTGFRGTFRFLKKAMFRIDGQLLDGTQCDYRFQHESSIGSNSKLKSRSRILQSFQPDMGGDDADGDDHDDDDGDGHAPQRNFEKLLLLKSDKSKSTHTEGAGRATNKPEGYWVGQRGYFFSPQYPSTYPKPVKCSYHFLTADPNQRVRLLFVDVSLRHDDQSCISNADVIHVYDGGDTDSDLIYQICGHTSFLEILSSTNQLLVEFISPENQTNYLNRLLQQQQTSAASSAIWQQSWKQHRSPRPSGKGFKAEYSFLSVTSLIHPNALPFSPFTPTISQYWPPYSANHTGSGNRPGSPGVSTITTTNAATNTTTTTITATSTSTMATIATCDHWFSSELHPNGTFQSINYPEPYPANIRCNYHFVGHGKQRVQVIFLDFDVYKVEDQHRGCEISDSLTAYVVTNGQKEYIDDFCGQELPPRIMSNGHRLTLEFKSLDHDHEPYRRFYKKINYPHQQQAAAAAAAAASVGVASSYLQHSSNHQLDQIQVDLDLVGGYQNLTATPEVHDEEDANKEQQQLNHVHVHGHKRRKKNNLAEHRNKLKKKQQQHNNRNKRKRRKKKLGTSLHNSGSGHNDADANANDGDGDDDDDHHQEDLTDEEFDDDEDEDEEEDDNDGRGTATIHHGHHHHHHNNHYHQHQHRNPKAKNLLQQQQPGGGRNKPGKVIVKNQTPGHASAGTSANVDALGRPYNRYRSKGFKAAFRFVTNFGIETGRQDSKSVCGFVYNSSESKQGYFTSPNYPGLYPKDTECHYFFYGNHTEKVRIEFVHFDVEGVTPCTLETASDYVEFSNAYSADRQVYRHCGLKHPKVVESEGDFFRITFKSNGRFDGTGFNATYRFVYSPYTPKHHSKADDDDDVDDDDDDADTDGGQQQSSKTMIKTGKSVKTGRKHNRNSSPSSILGRGFGSVAILSWTLTLSSLMLWWLWADL